MSARRHTHAAGSEISSFNTVNNFAFQLHILEVSAPRILDFPGAGRRRDAAKASRDAARREADERTARRLKGTGIDPWDSEMELHAVDLATRGERTVARGRQLRRLCVFHEHADRERRTAMALMAAYVEEARPECILHMRLRPFASRVPVDSLRRHDQAERAKLTRRLSYVARMTGGAVEPLAYGAHHQPYDGGAIIDDHFHVAVELRGMEAQAALKRAKDYLAGHYHVWVRHVADGVTDEDEVPFDSDDGDSLADADLPPAEALASYLREGTARYADQFSDENLAEYVRQVYGPTPLHRFQTLGSLRRFAGVLRERGVRPELVEEGAGAVRVALAPPPPRPARRTMWTAGPAVVALRLAWIDDELRPVALVRGWAGRWSELAERYDLDGAVEAACAALARSYTSTTDTPESSLSAAAEPPPSPPPTPPPSLPRVVAPPVQAVDYDPADPSDIPF